MIIFIITLSGKHTLLCQKFSEREGLKTQRSVLCLTPPSVLCLINYLDHTSTACRPARMLPNSSLVTQIGIYIVQFTSPRCFSSSARQRTCVAPSQRGCLECVCRCHWDVLWMTLWSFGDVWEGPRSLGQLFRDMTCRLDIGSPHRCWWWIISPVFPPWWAFLFPLREINLLQQRQIERKYSCCCYQGPKLTHSRHQKQVDFPFAE